MEKILERTSTMSANTVLESQKLLKLALYLDAAVTGVNGLAYVALAGPINDLLGIPVGFQRWIGAFLLAYGIAVWLVAGRPSAGAVLTVITLNVVWVAASVAALVTGALDLTTPGTVWAVLQAVVVGGFAAAQYAGLRVQDAPRAAA
jgi:hypothetical protein